jgi:CRP-like cAMP-binding protein
MYFVAEGEFMCYQDNTNDKSSPENRILKVYKSGDMFG